MQCSSSVDLAIRAGYRHIDLAEYYQNQREIGVAIKRCIEEGVVNREELCLVSKVREESTCSSGLHYVIAKFSYIFLI